MGKDKRLPDRLIHEKEECFPNLKDYRVTSPTDSTYNCVAHAAGDETQFWDPSMFPVPGYYWPVGASKGSGPESLRSCFEQLGFEVCDGPELEEGFEKIAIYVDNFGDWTHAARQEPNGEWSSKLGEWEDIRHRSPHCFGGSIYGNVYYFMKKPMERPDEEETTTEEE